MNDHVRGTRCPHYLRPLAGERVSMKLDPVPQGFARQWVECRRCHKLAHYIYQPYSIGNPVRYLLCCASGQHFNDTVIFLTAEQALEILVQDPTRLYGYREVPHEG